MRIARVKTEAYHNYQEGDCGSPIQKHGQYLCYYKKGFWKRHDRKKFIKNLLKQECKQQRNF